MTSGTIFSAPGSRSMMPGPRLLPSRIASGSSRSVTAGPSELTCGTWAAAVARALVTSGASSPQLPEWSCCACARAVAAACAAATDWRSLASNRGTSAIGTLKYIVLTPVFLPVADATDDFTSAVNFRSAAYVRTSVTWPLYRQSPLPSSPVWDRELSELIPSHGDTVAPSLLTAPVGMVAVAS